MKNIYKLMLVLTLAVSAFSCEMLKGGGGLTNGEMVAGLKEALTISSDTSVYRLNKTDGFFANQAIKILLPPEAKKVESTLRSIPGVGNALVDELILKMNRAAETAAKEALPIFKKAITNLTFNDVVNILNGPDDAATQYLKKQTYTSLQAAFQPPVEKALQSVGAQQAWNKVMTTYNSYNDVVPGTTDIPDNLAAHTTSKALDGLFNIVAQEEAKIRKNIGHQVTDLLKKVFGKNSGNNLPFGF